MRMGAPRREKSPARMPFEAQDKPARRTPAARLNATPNFKSMPHHSPTHITCTKHDDGLHMRKGPFVALASSRRFHVDQKNANGCPTSRKIAGKDAGATKARGA